jgi:hypothetical protein
MKTIYVLTVLSIFVLGCEKDVKVDTTPPAPPQGITYLALDNSVDLKWLPNTEPDLAGYNVWSSDSYNGRYTLLGTTTATEFVDYRAQNGVTYYYAISAFDVNKNESSLSTDILDATPRPEGFGVRLAESTAAPSVAGYDFSSVTVGPYDDPYTDFYFKNTGTRLSLIVWSDTDIQDMGYTASFDEIVASPTTGWSPTGTAEAISGHTYVVHTWDNHYAKMRVKEVATDHITFDWAYQLVSGKERLKTSSNRPPARGILMQHGS